MLCEHCNLRHTRIDPSAGTEPLTHCCNGALCKKCSPIKCDSCNMGCGLCVEECLNCDKDVCEKCHFNCEVCSEIVQASYCAECIVIVDKCIRGKCQEPLILRDIYMLAKRITCQDCRLADVILNTEKNVRKGFDRHMSLGDIREHLQLRSCFKVLHDHKEECRYAPGGVGLSRRQNVLRRTGWESRES